MSENDPLSPERLKELLAGIDPDILQQVMPLTGGVITMMFTDIVNSSGIKRAVGDSPYFDDILKPHNELVRDCISRHNGRELKTIGDSFFVGFAVPSDAVACSLEVQQRLEASPIQADSSPLQVRIGLHTGSPIVYRDPASAKIDLSGTDVDKAARVEGLAKGGQVLISEETKTLAKPTGIHDWGLWELRGLGRHRIYEVLQPRESPERPSGHPAFTSVRFLTHFVGREAEIGQVMNALVENRLVTLRGMGGIGKTRMADEVAGRVSQTFSDGVFFVELAQTRDSEAAVVSELVAKLAVNVAGFADEQAALEDALSNQQALLVLDNFEGVISAAPVVARLLKTCGGLRFLVSSQKLLGLDAEQQIEVNPMAPPQSDTTADSLANLDSFRLFRDRARLKVSNWELHPNQVSLLTEILELADGIPLSIELAAARVGSRPLSSMRDGLEKSRLEFLRHTGPAPDEKRHASIQACIDWSLKLLSQKERRLFTKLSVFAGGFFCDDVSKICSVGKEKASEICESLQSTPHFQFEIVEATLD